VSAGLRRRAVALIVCAVAATACGCASVDDEAQRSSLAALATQAPPPRGYDPPQVAVDCEHNPYGSLAPDRTLPPPGRMPRGSYMRRIQDRDGRELIVGVDQNTLRLAYFDPRRERIRGLDIELVREIAKAIFGTASGHIRFKAISTEQRISAIVSGDVDIVASAFSINCERRKSMYFSSVYYLARQKLLVPQDSPVESLSDLRGQRVCATKGSTSIGNLEGTGVKPYPVALRTAGLVALQTGTVAAITSDDSILFGFREQDPQTKIVGSCINVERYGMAINRSHPEFVHFVNGVLKRLGRRGLGRLRERWFPDLQAPTRREIARCDRRSRLRTERLERSLALGALVARESAKRWLGQLAVPVARINRCGRDCL
jgi:polar amino acid transport system substrate-binding protein